jgi:hypothetical protein
MTASQPHELLVETVDSNGEARTAHYDLFSVGASPKFTLQVANHSSDPAHGWLHDALSKHNGRDFQMSSTCSSVAFWHMEAGQSDHCLEASFFGKNFNNMTAPVEKGIFWRSFGGPTNSLTELKLAIRPVKPRRKVTGIKQKKHNGNALIKALISATLIFSGSTKDIRLA